MSAAKDYALKYLDSGFFPLPGSTTQKSPRFGGDRFGVETVFDIPRDKITPEEIARWDEEFHGNWNVLLITGHNGLVVIDLDSAEGYVAYCEQFPDLVETRTVKTSRGYHLWYKSDLLPPSVTIPAHYTGIGSIDIKAERRTITVPPSRHVETKTPYTWHKNVPMLSLPDMAKVSAWVNGFLPVKPVAPSVGTGEEINPEIKRLLTAHFESLGYKHDGEWLNGSCPFKEFHADGDKHPSFGYNSSTGHAKCFGHSPILTKELCEKVGIDWKAVGLFVQPHPIPLPSRKTTPPAPGWVHAPDLSSSASTNGNTPAASEEPHVHYLSSRQALKNYSQSVVTGSGEGTPLIMPYNILHQYGGFAHVLPGGKLAYFASVSGGGKTITAEHGWETLQRWGMSSIAVSWEWADEKGLEFAARAIQRGGGPSFIDYQLHLLQIARKELGKALTANDEQKIARAIQEMTSRKGEVFYITDAGTSIEKLALGIEDITRIERANGHDVRAVFVDFAQLLWTESPTEGMVWIEACMQKLKTTCRQLDLVGFVTSQLRKEDAQRAREGGELDGSMMQWLSDVQCNFGLVMAPKLDSFGVIDKHFMRCKIFKNSMAEPPGEFDLGMDYERLDIVDAPISTADL